MNKKLFILFSILMTAQVGAHAQRKCGAEQLRSAIIARYPEAEQKFEEQRASLQSTADAYTLQKNAHAGEKTTATSAIPVVFHIVVDSAQFNLLGGTAGIAKRCDSQIAVLNRDYNRQNSDSTLIPTSWKPLYASVGIHFGLAHTDPAGHGAPGYELKIIPASPGGFSSGSSGDYSSAKHNSSGGADAWDVTKYLNVWCIYFSDNHTLLGITSPQSHVTAGWIPANEAGVCLNYLTLGKRTAATDHYISTGYSSDYYDMGRTLTHEFGHFFEIWHTWGDDGGSCPWSGGHDDGLSDTPPEGDMKFGNYPYTITGGTYVDSCHNNGATNVQPIGVACLDFMNYTDDKAMQLFTPNQASVMASKVASGGENYTLTQNPALLLYPDTINHAAISQVSAEKSLSIFPNPTTGIINVAFDPGSDELQQISILNTLGRKVYEVDTRGNSKDFYSVDLSGLAGGIYFVQCSFVSGCITRKVLLE